MKHLLKTVILALVSLSLHAQTVPLTFTVSSSTGNFNINCINDSLVLTATSNYTPSPVTYVWNSNGNLTSGSTLLVTSPGIYTVAALAGSSQSTQTVAITSTNTPVLSVSPGTQTITCNPNSVTTITLSGSGNNLSHSVLSPQGGNFISTNSTVLYTPLGIGTYTDVLTDILSGCSSTKTFVLVSSQGLPTFSLTSPQNFTLGCNSKSVAVINIVGANTNPPGGPVSYSLTGPLGNTSTFSITTAGTWTAIVRDNTSFCETHTPFTVLQNTFSPSLNVTVPTQILNCTNSQVLLHGSSSTQNTSVSWSFPGVPGFQSGDTLSVNANFAAPSSTIIANYTLTITDNNSTCKSFSVIPMYQNLFKPLAQISSGGIYTLTCVTPTVMLTNISSSGIPVSAFPNNQPVIGLLWQGPAPQTPSSSSSFYLASTAGMYTLTAKDLNNGCTSSTSTTIYNDCNTTGIQKNSNYSLSIKIYPNPSNGQFELVSENINSNASLEIYNLTGQLIKKLNLVSNKTPVNITNETSGVYFVQVKQDNQLIFTGKIIKE